MNHHFHSHDTALDRIIHTLTFRFDLNISFCLSSCPTFRNDEDLFSSKRERKKNCVHLGFLSLFVRFPCIMIIIIVVIPEIEFNSLGHSSGLASLCLTWRTSYEEFNI